MEFDNTNRIVLFKNKKEKETHPDFKGSVNVEGVEYWVSIWETPDKKTHASGQITLKEDKPDYKKPAQEPAQVTEEVFDDSDQIPF